MKTHQLFCCLLTLVTSCVFTLKAATITGQAVGYIIVITSAAIFSKNVLRSLSDRRHDPALKMVRNIIKNYKAS